jgi:hypothetical protein
MGLDELLADAAGCPELQELEVVNSSQLCAELQPQEEAPTGRGLAALAGGACRGRLRRLVLVTPGSLSGSGGFPIHHVATLLGDGGCRQLEYLQLHVQLDLGALVELQLEQLGVAEGMAAADVGQQVATAGMLRGWLAAREETEELEWGMDYAGMLLERQLGALGVVGAKLGFGGSVYMGPLAHKPWPACGLARRPFRPTYS